MGRESLRNRFKQIPYAYYFVRIGNTFETDELFKISISNIPQLSINPKGTLVENSGENSRNLFGNLLMR